MRRLLLGAMLYLGFAARAPWAQALERTPGYPVRIVFVGFNFNGHVTLRVNGELAVDRVLQFQESASRVSLVHRHVLQPENHFELLINGFPRARANVSANARTRTVYIFNGREAVGFETSESETIALD